MGCTRGRPRSSRRSRGKFASEVYIAKNGRRVNAKSIMGVMMLAAGPGSTVTVDAEGPDEEQAMEAIGALIASRFGEHE